MSTTTEKPETDAPSDGPLLDLTDGLAPHLGDHLVVGAAAQQPPQVGLARGEQAVAHLAVGGQPGAIAVTA